MGCKADLRDKEECLITSEFENVKTTLQFAEMIGRYHQTEEIICWMTDTSLI